MTDQETRLTILMPNFNNGPFLRECLDSIFSQTYRDFYLLIVDDASTDDSIDIIESYNDPRVKILHKSTNSGIVDALNLGLGEIKTEYMMRMDGDDIMHPDRVRIMLEFMDANPHIGVCSSDIQTFGYNTSEIRYERNIKKNMANLVFSHSIGHASSIFRTAVFHDNGVRYSAEYPLMEDYDLFYSLRNSVQFTSIPYLLYQYRLFERHSNEALVSNKEKTYRNFYRKVMKDFGISGEKPVQIHFELSKNVELSFPLKDYREHIRQMIRINEKSGAFPAAELTEVLKKSYISVVYRLIEKGSVGWAEAVSQSLYYRKAFFYFWIKNKMKSAK